MKYVFLFIFILFATGLSQNDGSEALKNLQKKFDKIKTLSSDFSQYSGGKLNISGKFLYQKENKTRIEIKNIFIISDGVTTYNYNKKDNKVIISNFDESDPNVLSLEKFIYDYPSRCTTIDQISEGKNTIIFLPKDNSLNFKKGVITLNSESMISKIMITDKSGQSMDFVLSNLKTNLQIDADKFSFVPPDDAKVIDLR